MKPQFKIQVLDSGGDTRLLVPRGDDDAERSESRATRVRRHEIGACVFSISSSSSFSSWPPELSSNGCWRSGYAGLNRLFIIGVSERSWDRRKMYSLAWR